jgi:hypothetical protein
MPKKVNKILLLRARLKPLMDYGIVEKLPEANGIRDTHTVPATIVGMRFNGVGKLERGTRLRLVPQPENPYDSDALAVMTAEHKVIGHIAKQDIRRDLLLAIARHSGRAMTGHLAQPWCPRHGENGIIAHISV